MTRQVLAMVVASLVVGGGFIGWKYWVSEDGSGSPEERALRPTTIDTEWVAPSSELEWPELSSVAEKVAYAKMASERGASSAKTLQVLAQELGRSAKSLSMSEGAKQKKVLARVQALEEQAGILEQRVQKWQSFLAEHSP